MRSNVVLFSLFISSLSVSAAAAEPKLRPITHADAVLAIYVDDWRLLAGPPELVVAIWSDGVIVWSEDQINGGAPYRTGQVSEDAVDRALIEMQHDGVFAIEALKRARAPTDSRFTIILLKSAQQQLKMQSAHELRENDRRLAALRNGLHSQRSDARLAALATEPADYLYYRMIWAETRLRISQLIPTTSLRSSGKLMMKGGVVSWIEDGE